jgi:hypothetical protein
MMDDDDDDDDKDVLNCTGKGAARVGYQTRGEATKAPDDVRQCFSLY